MHSDPNIRKVKVDPRYAATARMRIFLTVIFMMIVLSHCIGCATKHIPLTYAPTPVPIASVAKPNTRIAVERFKDYRYRRKSIGQSNTITYKYRDDQDIGAWISYALAVELERCGFEVHKYTIAPPHEPHILRGSVEAFWIDGGSDTGGHVFGSIRVRAFLFRERVPLMRGEYFASEDERQIQWLTFLSKPIIMSAEATARSLARRLIPEIVEQLERDWE